MEKQFNQPIQHLEDKGIDYIFDYMHEMWLVKNDKNLPQYRFYVGIAGDMEQNYSRHKEDFGGNDFLYTAISKCKNAGIAAEVEQKFGNAGFFIGKENIGGKGGNKDSIYVYMYERPKSDKRI